MKTFGDFLTRTPKKDDFTEYIYAFADGTETVISRSELSPEIDDALYKELKKETNNNRVQIGEHRAYSNDPEMHDALLHTYPAIGDLEEGAILREAIQSLQPQQQELKK